MCWLNVNQDPRWHEGPQGAIPGSWLCLLSGSCRASKFSLSQLWRLGACPSNTWGSVRGVGESDARRCWAGDVGLSPSNSNAAVDPRRPNPPGARGLRAHTASLVVVDGTASTPPPSWSPPRKTLARYPRYFSDRLLESASQVDGIDDEWDD